MFRSNFVLFGIPISTTLYGDTAAGLASILIAVIIPLYNALAVVALEMFNGKKPSFFKILFGILTNPLILASAAGILFVVFQVPLPEMSTTPPWTSRPSPRPWPSSSWGPPSALGTWAAT